MMFTITINIDLWTKGCILPFPKKAILVKRKTKRDYPDLNRSQDIQSDASKSNSPSMKQFYAETKRTSDKVNQLADKFLPLEESSKVYHANNLQYYCS